MVDDVVVTGEDPVGEPVIADELPDVLLRVQFRGAGRQRQQRDIGGHLQSAGHVPAGLIQDHHRMCAWRHRGADLLEMSLHGGGIAPGHDQAGAFAFGRANGTEDIGRDCALVVGSPGARAASGPSAGQLVLLSDTGLILEPDLDLDTRADLFLDRRQFGGEVFLKFSIASAS
jgi:hypothetical protein